MAESIATLNELFYFCSLLDIKFVEVGHFDSPRTEDKDLLRDFMTWKYYFIFGVILLLHYEGQTV
jgi:hypothetical protein